MSRSTSIRANSITKIVLYDKGGAVDHHSRRGFVAPRPRPRAAPRGTRPASRSKPQFTSSSPLFRSLRRSDSDSPQLVKGCDQSLPIFDHIQEGQHRLLVDQLARGIVDCSY